MTPAKVARAAKEAEVARVAEAARAMDAAKAAAGAGGRRRGSAVPTGKNLSHDLFLQQPSRVAPSAFRAIPETSAETLKNGKADTRSATDWLKADVRKRAGGAGLFLCDDEWSDSRHLICEEEIY